MNALGLLEHFDRLIDTPDAVPRLRRFILDLAVRGKLVEQNPKDEPAGELLKRIEVEKARLMKAGKIRKQEALPVIDDSEFPFELPKKWQWVRLIEVLTKLTDGTHHSPPNAETGDFKYVTAKNIKPDGVLLDGITYIDKKVHTEIFSRCDPAKGDILYIKDGATTGVVTVNDLDEPFSMLSSVALLKLPKDIDNRLLVLFLRSPFFYDQMRGFMKGAAITRVTLKRMAPALIPLPPLAEQHRIVAKVDELMALCDELEAAQTKREKRRDRLVAATLHGLNNGDATPTPAAPSTFEESARFYFNHLSRLTTRPEHIHQLRQTILNLAVRGKLVPQDPKDEPSSKLLVRLSGGKEQIIKKLGLRQQPALPEDMDQVVPFQAPTAWAWSIVDECFIVTGGIQKTPLRTPKNNAYPYIGVSNVYRGRLDLSEIKQFELREGELEKLRLEPDDLLVVEGNGSASEVGRCARWTGGIPDCVHQNHIIRCRAGDPAIARFTEIYLNSETGVDTMRALAVTSAGLYNLSVGKIRRIQIPIPPLAEQHRIVAKVDELMVLCDELGARIASIFRTNGQLLKVVIEAALPGD